MESMANSHDKLRNGFAAYQFIIKKTNALNQERIRKELDKRASQTFSRKLFSIYRYRIANLRKPKSITEEVITSEQNESAEHAKPTKAITGHTKFSSCIHYYKRDLSPVQEAFPHNNNKTPYRQNFSNYEVNMMSKDFKDSLLKSMGGNVKCIQSTD